MSAEIAPISERLFEGILITIADTGWTADPRTVTLTVRGAARRINALTADSFTVVPALADDAWLGGLAQVSVSAPNGITATATPDSVLIRPRGNGGG